MFKIITMSVMFICLIMSEPSFAESSLWVCEYCGHGTGGCTKNPYGKKVHYWISK